MVRAARNASHRPGLAHGYGQAARQIRNQAELDALMTSEPGPWTLIKTADLQNLVDQADQAAASSVAVNWPELAAELASGLRGGRR